VAPERHFARRLEALAAAEGHRLEAIALAASGQGQSHQLANYEALGRAFAPDVVFSFFCVNDPWNNLFEAPAQGGRPVYEVDASGALVSTLAGRPERAPSAEELAHHAEKLEAGGLRTLRACSRFGAPTRRRAGRRASPRSTSCRPDRRTPCGRTSA
jgi:hypothetical protein